MGRKSETGGVSPHRNRIQIRFTYQGIELRPTLDMKPTTPNLKHARRIRESIDADIRAGVFKIEAYFPDYRPPASLKTEARRRTLREWARLWCRLQARTLENSTLSIYKRHLDCYWLSAFGNEYPQAVTHERVLEHFSLLATDRFDNDTGKLVRAIGRKTQNNIMIPLRGVFGLICKMNRSCIDPTEGIDNLKIQRPPPDPFEMREVEIILTAMRKHGRVELADYFEFAMLAGFRSSEQIALLWSDIDLRAGVAIVRRARVLGQDKENTKTNVVRRVELNARARAVIERQRTRTQLASEHVFVNPETGKPWHDDQVQRRAWASALKLAGVRYRPPKECRDTSVTIALQSGADPLWVAEQHGHSLIVMMRDYAKWIPGADRGRNLSAVNGLLSTDSASIPHQN